MISLIIATGNAHKVEEIRAILGGGFDYRTLKEFPGAPEAVEDAGTFAGNATKKAVSLAKWIRTRAGKEAMVLADDSGLEVDALGGAPGVHSARFAADETGDPGNSPTAANNAKLLRMLQGVPKEKLTARFRCVLALTPVSDRPTVNSSPVCSAEEFELATELFEGRCEGRIVSGARGVGGFGYDPLFVPEGYEQTYAELGEDTKNRISHRARALEQLKQWFAKRTAAARG